MAIGLVVGTALAAAHGHQAAAQTDASARASVNVVKATTGCFTDLVRVAGYLVPRRVAVVNVDTDGYRVSEVVAMEGDRVSAGQALARLTRPAQESANAPAAGAGQSGSSTAAGAGAQRPAPTTITLRAPVAGSVMKSNARVRELASPMAEPMFQIAIDSEVELEAQVPSIHVAKLKAGEIARIAIAGLGERVGKVRLIAPEIDKKSQLGRVRLALASDPLLRVGTFATATIDAKRSCGVAIPRDAVEYRVDGTSVRVVRDGTVAMRRVTVGLLSDDRAEVTEGLKDGEVVVANSGTSLNDGDKIKPKFPDEFDQPRGR
jgi:multidrug efflux pump subunit AcrA (membrane-fusion protein)